MIKNIILIFSIMLLGSCVTESYLKVKNKSLEDISILSSNTSKKVKVLIGETEDIVHVFGELNIEIGNVIYSFNININDSSNKKYIIRPRVQLFGHKLYLNCIYRDGKIYIISKDNEVLTYKPRAVN